MVVTCGPAQVAVEYGVVTGGFLIVAQYCAFVVELVVGTATVSALWDLAAGHVYVGGVAKLKAVLEYCVSVVGVHAFCLAGPVINAPGGPLSWDASWNSKGWFLVKGSHDRHKAVF